MRPFAGIGLLLLLTAPAVLGQQDGMAPFDLRSAVATALRENPMIASAERAADGSAARLSLAKSAAGFNMGLQSNYGYVTEATTFGGVPILEKNTLRNGLVLEKLVYSGGKVKSDIAQARLGLESSVKGTLAARDTITRSTAESYFAARMARDRINAANESVKALQASYDAAVKLKEAGIVTKADVLRSEVELEAAKERLLSAENTYQTALAVLKNVMGLDQDVEISLTVNPSDLETLDVDQVEPKERHDVASMKSALAAAEAGIKGARSSSLPQVYLQADFLNIAKGAFFPRQDNTAGLGFAVKLPIWDSGASRSAVVQAYSTRDQISQELRSVIQHAELEVKSAKLNIENARGRVKTTDLRVAAAEESLRVLQTGYKEGMTPLTDVLAAESALVNARFDRIAARYDVQIAQVKLLTAVGRADLLQP